MHVGHIMLSRAARIATVIITTGLLLTAASGQGTIEDNSSRVGGDYKSFFTSNQPDPTPCQAACVSEPQCRAWTLVRPPIQGAMAKCVLKSAVVTAQPDRCCVSGVVRPDSSPATAPAASPNQAAPVAAGGQQPGQGTDLIPYWQLPLQPQGPAPATWATAEQMLLADACGRCHADQLAPWQKSIHSRALSPGLTGQLLNLDGNETAQCLECHASLDEQRQAFEAARSSGVAHLSDKQGLAAEGITCATCHVRNQTRFGPPRRDAAAAGPSVTPVPHGGATRSNYFQSSEFCAGCHQLPADGAVNGKPLQNTFAEWLTSSYAEKNMTCQSCHMPDRRHLWRGIHDQEMVASGLTPIFEAQPDKARFSITNTRVGHAFPTYVTPKVVLNAVGIGADGRIRPETLVTRVIARRVSFTNGQWQEASDTRLWPGQSMMVEVAWQDSDIVRAWLEVHPDDHYVSQVYPDLLAKLGSESAARLLLQRASDEAKRNAFRLFETDIKRQR
jgi:hypothetical protein